MSIHVNADLDQDQPIYKSISFYDLVELMTFGRLSFHPSSSICGHSVPRPDTGETTGLNTATRAI